MRTTCQAAFVTRTPASPFQADIGKAAWKAIAGPVGKLQAEATIFCSRLGHPDLPPDTQGTMSMGEEMECARRCGIPTARRLTQTPYNSFHAPACRPLVSSGTHGARRLAPRIGPAPPFGLCRGKPGV
jgi:hypothetical protein